MAEFAAHLRRDLVSHTRKVQSLFKRIARNEADFYREHSDIQFVWATVRGEFEKHRNVRDLRTAKMLLEEGERKLWLHKHPKGKKFLFSPGGLMYEREHVYPDVLLDYWHPVEKAQYPTYFANRELRKQDLQQLWQQQKLNNNNNKSDPEKH